MKKLSEEEKIEKLKSDLKRYITLNGIPKYIKRDFKPYNNLCSPNVYHKYLGGSLIDWIDICDIKISDKERYDIVSRGGKNTQSKEEIIKIIYTMQKELNRNLYYDDFRNPNINSVGISTINKYWGSLNKMKTELKLDVNQESMIKKQLTKEDFILHIQFLVNIAKSENRDFITTREIRKYKNIAEYGTLDRMSKKYFHIPLSKYILQYNVHFGKSGNGLNYLFDDGEKTYSYYEYSFSKFLRMNGLIYNIDYFRDVKYSKIDSVYTGQMNCDYEIHYKNKIIYVEIAGIIEAYKTWYYLDNIITCSKSKEKYRQKLKEKELMLKRNNCIYFILFPCDLIDDKYLYILNDSSLKLKHEIENFYKNNINWNFIKEKEI